MYKKQISQEFGGLRSQQNISKQFNLNSISNQNILDLNKSRSTGIIKEPKIELDKSKKYHVEFLIRLFCFEDKLSIKIKNSSLFGNSTESGYIINHKIIDIFKDFYEANKLKHFLKKDIIYQTLFKKYRNNYNYISENNIDNYLKEEIENIPKEYIKEIQPKNNSILQYYINQK